MARWAAHEERWSRAHAGKGLWSFQVVVCGCCLQRQCVAKHVCPSVDQTLFVPAVLAGRGQNMISRGRFPTAGSFWGWCGRVGAWSNISAQRQAPAVGQLTFLIFLKHLCRVCTLMSRASTMALTAIATSFTQIWERRSAGVLCVRSLLRALCPTTAVSPGVHFLVKLGRLWRGVRHSKNCGPLIQAPQCHDSGTGRLRPADPN